MIDFSQGHNLKAVYDAGLRPWRILPTEDSILTVTSQKIGVLFPDSESFVIPAEVATFSVLVEYELSSMDITTTVMPIATAVSLTKQICRSLRVPTNGLDELASAFPARPAENELWIQDIEKKGIRIRVGFQPHQGFNDIRAMVSVSVEFPRRDKIPKFFTEPIRPPPGYEHLSLDPPPIDPKQEGFPKPEDYHNSKTPPQRKPGQPETVASPEEFLRMTKPTQQETSSGNWHAWSPPLLLAICGILAWLLKRKRS